MRILTNVLAGEPGPSATSRELCDAGKEPPFISPTRFDFFQRYKDDGKIPPNAYKVRITDAGRLTWENVKVWISDEERTTLTLTRDGNHVCSNEYIVFIAEPNGNGGQAYNLPRTITLEGKTIRVHPYHEAQWHVTMEATYKVGDKSFTLQPIRRPFFFFEPLDEFHPELSTENRISAENDFAGVGMLVGYGGFHVAKAPKDTPEFKVEFRVLSGPLTLGSASVKTDRYIAATHIGIDANSLQPGSIEAQLKSFKLPHGQKKEYPSLPDPIVFPENIKWTLPAIQPIPGKPANLAVSISKTSFVPGESAAIHIAVTDSKGRAVEDGAAVGVELSGDGQIITGMRHTVGGSVDVVVRADSAPWDKAGGFVVEVTALAGALREYVSAEVPALEPPVITVASAGDGPSVAPRGLGILGVVSREAGKLPLRTKPPKPPKPSQFEQTLARIESPTGTWADLLIAFLPGVEIPQDAAAVLKGAIQALTGSAEFSAFFMLIDSIALATDFIPGADQAADVVLKPIKKTSLRVAQAGVDSPIMKKFINEFEVTLKNVNVTSPESRKQATTKLLADYEKWKKLGKIFEENAEFAAMYGAKHVINGRTKHILDGEALDATLRLFNKLDDAAGKQMAARLLRVANDVNVEAVEKVVKALPGWNR